MIMQLPVHRILISAAYLVTAFVIDRHVLRAWQNIGHQNDLKNGLIASFGPIAVLTLAGAGFGQLFGKTAEGAKHGALAGVVMWLLWMAWTFGAAMFKGSV